MHERCETVNQPRASPPLTNQQSAWRPIMHMKSCPKLVRSEVRLEPGTRSVNCGNPGVVGGVAGVRGRSPLTVISANTLHHGNNHNANGSGCHGDAWRRKAKGSQGGEGLYRKGGGGGATGVEGEGPVDIWAVIKPGNVRQKIAIFTSVSPPIGGSDSWGEDALKHEEVTPVSTPARPVSLKVKGGVRDRESCSSAKRRRRSGSNRHHLHHQQRDLNTNASSPGEEPLSQAARGSGGEAGGEEEEDGGGGVCVVDMVALLEQKANVNTHTGCTTKAPPSAPPTAPATAPPTTTAPPSAPPTTAPPSTPPTTPPSTPNEGSEVEEGSEVIRVSDMVARLESECLKRSNSTSGGGLSRSNSTSGGGLSRSNSLRRGQPSSPPLTSSSSSSPPSLLPEVEVVSSALPVVPVRPSEAEHGLDRETPERLQVCLEEVRGPRPTSGDGGVPREPELEPPTSSQAQPQPEDHSDSQCNVRSLKPELLTAPRPEEPPPGMLFFSSGPLSAHSAHASIHSAHAPTHTTQASAHATHGPIHATLASTHATHGPTDPCSTSPLPPTDCRLSPSPCESESGREEERRSSEDDEEQGGVVACFPLHRSVSQEFLAVRQRIQRLLDPQPFLTLLPHHLLVHIFSLLPTCSLAALQCTCHYFRLVIRSYGIRPADSRWVSDPRYRDDPCKQCKKRYGRGDVSLCRWHHKPYCQAHPYGPGFWMCCHGLSRDTPGCNVGLHDNRWVPAFHSINAPVYRRGGGLGQRNEDSVED